MSGRGGGGGELRRERRLSWVLARRAPRGDEYLLEARPAFVLALRRARLLKGDAAADRGQRVRVDDEAAQVRAADDDAQGARDGRAFGAERGLCRQLVLAVGH